MAEYFIGFAIGVFCSFVGIFTGKYVNKRNKIKKENR